jgi:hypothetical protein
MTNAPALQCLIVVAVLSGCSDPVPQVADPHNIVVSGQPMTQQEFLLKFCSGKVDNETCLKVSQAMALDSGRSKDGPARF